VAQKLIWHQTRQPKPIRTLRPQVPEGLAGIIDKMMAKDPAQRFQAPGALAEALVPWTQTPIGPPPEAEMPRLSLAATGVAPGETTTVGPAPPSLPSSGQRKSWQVPPSSPGSKPPGKPPDTRSQGGGPVSPAPQQVRAPSPALGPPSDLQPTLRTRPNSRTAVAPEPQPAADEESAPWEKLTTDTDDPSAKVNTAPRSSRKGVSRSPSRSSSKSLVQPAEDRKRLWWVVGGVTVLVLALLLLAWWKFGGSRTPKSARVIKVNKAAGQAGDFRTIKEALEKAEGGDRIVVAGGEYEEQIVLRHKKAITIEAGEGEVVILPPRDLGDSTPLLNLFDAQGVHIKGLKLRGGNRLKNLVAVFGNSAGLTLENLQLEGFKEGAVLITNCAGSKDHPVTLVGLQTLGDALSPPRYGVEFQINQRILDPKTNNHVHMRDCQFRANAVIGGSIKLDTNWAEADITWNGKSVHDLQQK
jgi:hypothetical protein